MDCHHTIEDCGIALGMAIREALGDKAGIVRYCSCMLPMDETLALCAVDLGGRPYFVYVVAKKAGTIESSESNQIIVKNDDGTRDVYKLTKFSRSNQSNCYNHGSSCRPRPSYG